MIKSGFALEKISTGAELAWWEHIPPTLAVPGELITVDAAAVGWAFGDYRIAAKDKELEDPAPVRRLVLKSVIVDRLYEMGKLDAARATLDAADLYTRERWNNRTAIYADDESALALLRAIGADPALVLA